MSKITKLIKNPAKFFKDIEVENIFRTIDIFEMTEINFTTYKENNRIAVCIGFNPWKRDSFSNFIPNYNTLFIRGKTPVSRIIKALRKLEDYDIFIWSYSENKTLYRFLKRNKIKIYRVEDGFIRSFGLGSDKTIPLSLAIDNDSIYFNPHEESRLENIIFKRNGIYSTVEVQEAKNNIDLLISNNISKYNFPINIDQTENFIQKNLSENRKIILVLGQVEKDMSIKLGCNRKITNLDVLKIAKKENPFSIILFKPHPDLMLKKKTNVEKYEKFSDIVPNDVNLSVLIESSDHVYTITSLSGFEALIRGKKVTCFGSPFYAHWGLTDDRQNHKLAIERRSKYQLSIEELFYTAYIEYPIYLEGDLTTTVELIKKRKFSRSYSFADSLYLYTPEKELKDTKLFLDEIKTSEPLRTINVALLTESSDIQKLYQELNYSVNTNVDVFTMTLIAEKILRKKDIVNKESCHFISKAYLTPLGDLESKAVHLAKKVSKNYTSIINRTTGKLFESNENSLFSEILGEYFEDLIFNECVIYLALHEIVKEYDYIVFNYNPKTPKHYNYLLESYAFKDKVLFAVEKKDKHEFLKESYPKIKVLYNKQDLLNKANIEFFKIWNSAYYDCNKEEGESATFTLCANMSKENYAYYPSSQEVLHLCNRYQLSCNLLPASFVNEDIYNEYKQIVNRDIGEVSKNNIFPAYQRNLLKANKNLGLKIGNKVVPSMEELINDKLYKELQNDLYYFLLPRISRCIDDFSVHVSLYFELKKYIQNTEIYITTMERTFVSRLGWLAAMQNNIPTIGIQPQVISTSLRYRKPLVDQMLVIDSLQEDNFIKLKYPKNNITKIGSANLRKHLQLISDAEPIPDKENEESIIFIMQHSMPETMYESIHALIDAKVENIIYIKPHPHQEDVVLNNVEKIISQNKNLILLEKDDDTYTYIKHAKIVIGLFSSVVYEAILANKHVIILKLEELHESIDFTKFNACLSVTRAEEIKEAINDFVYLTEKGKKVIENQEKYIRENNYIYNNNALKNMLFKELTIIPSQI